MTIKLLSGKEDWDDIESLINTRKKFQKSGMTDELHTKMKQHYVKDRIDRDDVYFFGYYFKKELVAISSFHRCPFEYDVVQGIGWTKAGNKVPRWPTCQHRSTATIELLNHAVSYFEKELSMSSMWIIGPADITWERVIDVEGCTLANRKKYTKIMVTEVPALKFTGSPFIDQFILVNHPLPTEQVIFRMARLDWKSPSLPEGFPPMCNIPAVHAMPERGKTPTPHDPPPIPGQSE